MSFVLFANPFEFVQEGEAQIKYQRRIKGWTAERHSVSKGGKKAEETGLALSLIWGKHLFPEGVLFSFIIFTSFKDLGTEIAGLISLILLLSPFLPGED